MSALTIKRSIGMLAVPAIATAALAADSATVATFSSTSSFEVSSSDLLETHLDSVTVSPSPYYTGTPVEATEPVLRDGLNPNELPDSFGSGPVNSSATVLLKDNASIVYNLTHLDSPLGFELTSIQTFGHWDGGRDRQDITIHYALVTNPTDFLHLVTYSFQPPNAHFSRVSVMPEVGNEFLATGVSAIRFTFPNQKSGAAGYREFDVNGTRVTEPSTAPSKIAFFSDRDGNREIYLMNVDGTEQTRLTTNVSDDYDPAWSPTGAQIVFVSERDNGNPEIYVMNADGSSPTRLTDTSEHEGDPSWSPDGTQIAFGSSPGGHNHAVYVMDADGSNRVSLRTNFSGAGDEAPAWSPDGTKIAFMSHRGPATGWDIYVMNADGSNQTPLAISTAFDGYPEWSPDGTAIAFFSERDSGNSEIYVMNADGSNLTRITNDALDDYSPSWSPDGSHIAFNSNRDGNHEIHVMDADGSNPTNLTMNNPSGDYQPAWSPQSVADTDVDGIPDSTDNCLLVPNTSQLNSDIPPDPYGNACDADFDNDGAVDGFDFSAYFLPCFIKGFVASFPECATSDFDGDGAVTGADFTEVFLPQFSKGTPGP